LVHLSESQNLLLERYAQRPEKKSEGIGIDMTLTDEIKTSVVVAEASTKAMTRSILYGTIPIIEFGVVIAFALLVAAVPLAIIKKVK